MEGIACVKDVVQSAGQYLTHMSDSNLIQLQRKLDVLVSVTQKDISFFNPKELLFVECITCMIDVLKNPESKSSLVHKVMQLLSNLCNDPRIRESLSDTFHVTNWLTYYLNNDMISDAILVLCVTTLQKVTYGMKVSFQGTYIEDLVAFLLEHIPGKQSELTEPCLGLMANICRNNFSVQTHIKNKETIRSFYKALLTNLSHGNQRVVIFSLSVLFSLGFGTEMGDKLFSAKNINKTFMLMFNILLNDNDFKTRTHVVDLFVDMLRQKKIQQYLSVYAQLATCLRKVFFLVINRQHETAAKVFELLLAFCSVNSARTVVCKTLLESSTLKDPLQYQELLKSNHGTEPFFAVVHWASQPVHTHGDTPLVALDFLREIYEEMLSTSLNMNVSPRTDLVLPMLTNTLENALLQDQQPTKRYFLKLSKALRLLKTVILEDSIQLQIAKSVDPESYRKLVEYQLIHNKLNLGNSICTEEVDWSECGVEVVFLCLDLMVQLQKYVKGMDGILKSILQEQRILPFLANGMTSENREIVQTTLSLIGVATTYKDFPVLYLGDSIASVNANRCKKEETKKLNPDIQINSHRVTNGWYHDNKENVFTIKESSISNLHSRKSQSSSKSSDVDESVASIIDKMHTGLDFKDLRTSEIVSVYDQRLQSFQTKENHLQDLLDAKSLALEQADRLIAQYRCRKAQAEAESHKMRKFTHESEKQNEELRENLNDAMLEKEALQATLEKLSHENTRLEAIAEEHRDLSQAYNEQTQRLENVEKLLYNLKQEHKAVTEMHEMLRRHNETLKQQHDVASQQLVELEEERKTLSRQIKEKDGKLSEFTKSMKKTDDRLKKLETDRDDLEVATDKLRSVLDKAEQTKKELQQKLQSLELVCRKHESDIREKDSVIANYKTEIDKHAQIAALIHNLSSGKNVDMKK